MVTATDRIYGSYSVQQQNLCAWPTIATSGIHILILLSASLSSPAAKILICQLQRPYSKFSLLRQILNHSSDQAESSDYPEINIPEYLKMENFWLQTCNSLVYSELTFPLFVFLKYNTITPTTLFRFPMLAQCMFAPLSDPHFDTLRTKIGLISMG